LERDDLIYAAGLFDGEGCISTSLSKPTHMPRLVVSVQMCDASIITWLHRTFGIGTVFQSRPEKYYSGRCRPQFVWQASCGQAEVVLELLLPFLKVKRPQAERALALRRLPKLTLGKAKWLHRHPDQIVARRAALAEGSRLRLEISSLNRTGTLPE